MSKTDIRYLTPIDIEVKKEKYCRFKKAGIKKINLYFSKIPKKSSSSYQEIKTHCSYALRYRFIQKIKNLIRHGCYIKPRRRACRR